MLKGLVKPSDAHLMDQTASEMGWHSQKKTNYEYLESLQTRRLLSKKPASTARQLSRFLLRLPTIQHSRKR